MNVELGVLGPLEVRLDGRVVVVPAGRVRVLLASLLLRPNLVVSVDALVDRLWDGGPPNPARAKSTLQMVVTRLRQALGPVHLVRTATDGYVADVPPGSLDLHRFRGLVDEQRYAEALSLWRGEPLQDVRSDSLHRDEVAPLLEERLVVLERRLDVDLAAGRAAEIVGELRGLTGRHPLRERFWAQLMRALYEAGRQAEALAAYDEVRTHLAEELGIDPGAGLKDLHARILSGDVGRHAPTVTVPRQLPPPGDFVGRAEQVADLTAMLRNPSARLPIGVIAGPPGIGKTALAVHVAHLLRDAFPGGQLFVDMHGYSPDSRVPPVAVLARFLRALGVAAEDVPGDLDEQSSLYRSLLAERRVLVVLDNVRRVDDVRPLLPGHPHCAVLVTSRQGVPALIAAQGARQVTLEPLRVEESRVLLRSVLGDAVLDAAPAAADAVASTCAHWPLALRVAAANLASRLKPDLRSFAAELSADDRLDALAIEGEERFAVRAAFHLSYVDLEPAARGLFRLLGLVPGVGVSGAAMTALAGGDVRRVLHKLHAANLVHQQAFARFRQHDLLHEYAAELAAAEDDEAVRRAAMDRLLAFYLHTSRNATGLLRSFKPSLGAEEITSEWAREFTDRGQALEWCETEQANIAALTRWAAVNGFTEYAWRLPISLWAFFDLTKRFSESIPLLEVAVEAVGPSDNVVGKSLVLQGLALLYNQAQRIDEAIPVYERVLALRRADGQHRGVAVTLNALAICYLDRGDNDTAFGMLEESRRILHDLGERHMEGITLNTLGGALTEVGRAEEAVERCAQALRLIDDLVDPVYEGRFLDNYGKALHAAGRHEDAIDAYRRARVKAVEAGDRTTEGAVLENLGRILADTGDPAGAREHWSAALALFPESAPAATRLRKRLAGL